MQQEKTNKAKKTKDLSPIIKYCGIGLLLFGLILLIATYIPVISAYISYQKEGETTTTVEVSKEQFTEKVTKETEVVYMDSTFGLYIPKIGTNAKVIRNIDPYNKEQYTTALETGIAHAKESSLPGENGNIFLFAHSAVNFYERNKYHVYFYLLGELETNDIIYISYNSEIYKYKVTENKIVDKTEVKYLSSTNTEEQTLTLMTCWPAGTDWKRTLIVATRVED